MLHGAVLRENQAMIKLCQDLGFTVPQDSSDPATLKAVLRLPRL
jgi:hypothetical protein